MTREQAIDEAVRRARVLIQSFNGRLSRHGHEEWDYFVCQSAREGWGWRSKAIRAEFSRIMREAP